MDNCLNTKIKIKKIYYKNKQIKSEIRILNGVKHGVCKEWYQNGQLKDEREFENDEMNGRWREWHENGQLKWDSIQTNGWPYNGYQRAWNEDGKLQLSSNYKEGKLHGVLYRCDNDGQETREYWWKGKQQKYNIECTDLMIEFLNNQGFEVKAASKHSGPKL